MHQKISIHHPDAAGIGDTIPSQGSNVSASIGFMKVMGLKKSPKLSALANSEGSANMFKEIKVCFMWMAGCIRIVISCSL